MSETTPLMRAGRSWPWTDALGDRGLHFSCGLRGVGKRDGRFVGRRRAHLRRLGAGCSRNQQKREHPSAANGRARNARNGPGSSICKEVPTIHEKRQVGKTEFGNLQLHQICGRVTVRFAELAELAESLAGEGSKLKKRAAIADEVRRAAAGERIRGRAVLPVSRRASRSPRPTRAS